jgi:hypothetical protein
MLCTKCYSFSFEFVQHCITTQGNGTLLEGDLRSHDLHLSLLWWLDRVLSMNEITEEVKISFMHLHDPS